MMHLLVFSTPKERAFSCSCFWNSSDENPSGKEVMLLQYLIKICRYIWGALLCWQSWLKRINHERKWKFITGGKAGPMFNIRTGSAASRQSREIVPQERDLANFQFWFASVGGNESNRKCISLRNWEKKHYQQHGFTLSSFVLQWCAMSKLERGRGKEELLVAKQTGANEELIYRDMSINHNVSLSVEFIIEGFKMY